MLTHGSAAPDVESIETLCGSREIEILVAGGVSDMAAIRRLRDVGVSGLLLGQILLSGVLDYREAASAGAA